jgi:hypothetical protein
MAFKLTKKQIVAEIIRCGKDPVYFINNFCRISHPLEGTIPFSLYDFQADCIEKFNEHRFNVINKGRQLGISTTAAAYICWMMLFHRDKNILVVATKLSTASNLVKKVKFMMKSLPDWMMIAKITTDNKNSFELANGSQIKASSTSGDAGRSEALTLLVIDEAAHIEGLDELWTGLYPTLSTGGRCIALSTPNGVGNWFHKTFTEAEEDKNDFNTISLPWSVHPDRDEEWFAKETRNMSRRQIAQELECSFNFSGETLIHGEDLERLQQGLTEPKYKTGHDRNFWIWEPYEPGKNYVLVADVARGDGKDFSAFQVFETDTMTQVAEYQGKPTLDVYSEMIFEASREYGFCLTVVENNSIGMTVLDKLRESRHPNVYYSIKHSHSYVDMYEAQNASNAVPGVTMSSKSRPLIIAKFEEFIRTKLITIKSQRLANEMKTFIWNNGRAEAMRGYNDDLVMACAISCWIRDIALVANKREMEYKMAFAGNLNKSKKEFNTKIPGQIGYNNPGKKLKEQHNQYKNFAWLFKG